METTTNTYTSYHAMSAAITEGLGQMAKICSQLELDERAESLLESRRKLQDHRFSVGILGEFKRGKSTVINSLLGQEIMPADITPCSATMNRVTYGLTPRAQLHMLDGSYVDIPVEELAEHVTKLDEDAIARSAKVDEAIVYYPCRFCQNGVDIVDTPGLNDDERMNKITEDTVPKLDAVIMVLVADNPFSMSEAEFVRNKLMCSDVGRLIFLVNKIDTVRPRDRDRAVKGIRDKIQKTVLEKTADVYGADSEQYRIVQSKLADIRIYPISAMNALDGRLDGDDKLLEQSGALEFEAALSRMLTEERGILELSAPLMKLLSLQQAVNEVIEQKLSCMELKAEEFLKTQQDTAREIRKLREEKQAEKKNLQNRSLNLRNELSGKAEQCYQEIETAAQSILDEMTPKGKMSASDSQELLLETTQKIEKKIESILAVHSERLIAELNAVVREDSQNIVSELVGRGTASLNQHLNAITIASKGGSLLQSAGAVAAEVAIGTYIPVFGMGGAIQGYQAAGFKGGAVGGLGGCAISFAAAVLAASAGVALLPAVVLGAAAGAFGGKAIVKKVFKNDIAEKKLEDLKKKLQPEITNAIVQMRLDRVLEKWIQDEVGAQYDILIKTMEDECEKVIEETQRKINSISQCLTATKAEQDAQRKKLVGLSQEAAQMLKDLEPICLKVLAAPAAVG